MNPTAAGRPAQALTKTEHADHRLFEMAADLLAVADAEGYFVRLNPAWEQALGYPRAALLHRPLLDFVHEDDRTATHAHLEQTRAGNRQPDLFVNRFRCADGAYRRLAWNVVFSPEDGLLYGVARDVTGEPSPYDALSRQSAILAAAAFAAEQLLKKRTWEDSIDGVLERLGTATGASRVYLFQNHPGDDGTLLTSQRYEWTAPGVASQQANPDLQDCPYVDAGFGRWVKLLSAGQALSAAVAELPAEEQALLMDQDIRSIAVMPVFKDRAWWGFIGFDDCQRGHAWAPEEIDALRVAAGALGAAIHRQEREQTLHRLNETLEERVAERTRELAEKERFLRSIFDGVHEIIYVLDVTEDGDFRFVTANSALDRLTGRKAAEVPGKSIEDLVPPGMAPQVRARFQQCVRSGAPMEYETQMPGLEGETWWLVRLSPLRDETGRIYQLVGLSIPITELKLAQEKLRRSEERLRLALLGADIQVWDWNLRTDALHLYFPTSEGRVEETISTGEEANKWLHEDDRDRVQRLAQQVIDRTRRGGDPVLEYESRVDFPGAAPEHIYVRGQVISDAEGPAGRMVGVTLNVNRRKRAEEALRQSESLLEATLEQMPSGVFIAEAPSGKLLFHNNEAARLLRHPFLPAEDYAGYARYGALHADGRSYAPEAYPLTRALFGETIRNEEMRYRRGDGTLTTISVNAAPVRDAEGEIVRAIATFHDVSAWKAVQGELETFNELLEERVEKRTGQVRRLASALSLAEQRERHRVAQILHDHVQQILYGTRMKVEFLGQDIENPALQAPIQEIGALLGEAIDDLRTLTVDLSPPVLQGEGLEVALRWLARQMHALHGLAVEVEAVPTHVPDEAMRILLFQIIRELLFNTAKHAGTDHARVCLHSADGSLRIEVVDEGAGFDVTAALDAATGNNRFGLQNVRERLGFFGGTLGIESAPGEGTRLTLTIPLDGD